MIYLVLAGALCLAGGIASLARALDEPDWVTRIALIAMTASCSVLTAAMAYVVVTA